MNDTGLNVIIAQSLGQNRVSKQEETEFMIDCYNKISKCQIERSQNCDHTVVYQCNECKDYLKYSTSGDVYTLTEHHLEPLSRPELNGSQFQTYEDNSRFLKHFKEEGSIKDFQYHFRYYLNSESNNYEGFEMQSGNKKLHIESCAVSNSCYANAVVLMDQRSYKFINRNTEHTHPLNVFNQMNSLSLEDFPDAL